MERDTTSADGIPLSFDVLGAGSPTLVFVHGWSCDRSYWRHQVGHFAEHHQVVAIDLAGHGRSGTGRTAWTMPAFGEDVVAVANELGLQDMVLVGHSMGGDVIVEAARRLSGRLAGLVWVDVYKSLGHPPSSSEEIEAFLSPFRADFAAAARPFIREFFLPTSDPDLVDWVVEDMAAAPPAVAVSALEHAFTFEPTVAATVPWLGVPVVAINPDDEPTDVEALARHGVTTVLMPGMAHFLMLEDPATFNQLLETTIRGFTPASGPVRSGERG